MSTSERCSKKDAWEHGQCPALNRSTACGVNPGPPFPLMAPNHACFATQRKPDYHQMACELFRHRHRRKTSPFRRVRAAENGKLDLVAVRLRRQPTQAERMLHTCTTPVTVRLNVGGKRQTQRSYGVWWELNGKKPCKSVIGES